MELPESVSTITSDPKKLLLVVGAGVGAGLLWRYYSGKKAVAGAANVAVDASGNPYDSMQGAGNLGAFGGAIGGGVAATADRRDVVDAGITLPVSQWIITGADGIRYLTDGVTISPLDTTAPAPNNTDLPAGTSYGGSN